MEKPGLRGICIMGEYHKERRIKMLAKLIKNGNDDPAAEVTANLCTFEAHDWGVRRVGVPRKHWLTITMEDMWNEGRER